MTQENLIHNSKSELVITPELIDRLGATPMIFMGEDGTEMPYRQFISGAEQEGDYGMMIFFHGAGSVGRDNFLHVRIPGPPIMHFCLKHNMKMVVLFPQCPSTEPADRWVSAPWDAPAHVLAEHPTKYMDMAMSLLKRKIIEFKPDPRRIYAGGVSMGGFAAWDIVSRMPFTFAAILSICGGADVAQAKNLAGLGVYAVHGSDDGAVSVSRSRNMISALRANGNTNLVYRELEGAGHNVWDATFADEDALKWIFARRKNQFGC